MKGLLRNIARDVLLAPSLALTALVFLAWSDHVALDRTIVAGLLLGTGWIVWKGAYWADWAPFLAPRERLPFAEITSACGSVFALTASFAGLSYVLAGEGALAVAPAGQALSVWEAVGVFTWHLLDAVPLLEIPSTLNWELTPRFTDYVGGSFLLFYKLLVIIPVIRVVVTLVQRRRHEPTASPTPASE